MREFESKQSLTKSPWENQVRRKDFPDHWNNSLRLIFPLFFSSIYTQVTRNLWIPCPKLLFTSSTTEDEIFQCKNKIQGGNEVFLKKKIKNLFAEYKLGACGYFRVYFTMEFVSGKKYRIWLSICEIYPKLRILLPYFKQWHKIITGIEVSNYLLKA